MQLDGGRTFAAGLAARLRSTLDRVSLRCAVALFSITLRVAFAALWCTLRCAKIFELYLCWQTSWSVRGTNFWITMDRVALATGELCERPWRSMSNESFHRLRSNNFEVCVLFERAHSLEPAHIHSTALACCAQCTSCEALVCARSVSVRLGGHRLHGDHRCDLHGGGPCVGARDPKLRSGTYKPKNTVCSF